MSTEATPVLSVSDLSMQVGDVTILRGINWKVERGEHWVMLGANGSGKTSLLAALLAYATPSAGEIRLLGETFGETDWRELRRSVGLVSSAVRQKIPDEEAAFETVVSGRHAVIGHWGRISPEERKEAEKLLRQVRCGALAEREWRVLSQGERQRVLIARSLMAKPALLILDEPCAGLDPVAREQFLQFLQQLAEAKGSPSLVLVTHHVEEIVPGFSHALLLRKGQVVALGIKKKVLIPKNLQKTFGAKVRLVSRDGRYRMDVCPQVAPVL